MLADKRKIRLMAKLASYDKNQGEKDKKILEFYKWDYVYKNNALNRICVTLGFLVFAMLYAAHRLLYMDAFEGIDYVAEIMRLGGIWVGLMVVYTAIGVMVYSKRYKDAQIRIRKYFSLMEKLDEKESPFQEE